MSDMKKQAATIDTLARMVKEGFDRTAAKSELAEVKRDMDQRFDHMNDRFDRVENILYGGLSNRLEKLEDEVRVLKTKAEMR